MPLLEDKESDKIEEHFLDALDVNHRIADTQRVKPIHLPLAGYVDRRTKIKLPILTTTLIVGIILVILYTFKGASPELHYLIPNEKGGQIEVSIKPQTGGDVRLQGITEKGFKKTLPATDFLATPGMTPKIVPSRKVKFMTISIILLYVVAPLVMILLALRLQQKDRRIRTLLYLDKPKNERKSKWRIWN